jgi:hypothetical protein
MRLRLKKKRLHTSFTLHSLTHTQLHASRLRLTTFPRPATLEELEARSVASAICETFDSWLAYGLWLVDGVGVRLGERAGGGHDAMRAIAVGLWLGLERIHGAESSSRF